MCHFDQNSTTNNQVVMAGHNVVFSELEFPYQELFVSQSYHIES